MSTFSSISGLNFGFSEADWALDADVIVAKSNLDSVFLHEGIQNLSDG